MPLSTLLTSPGCTCSFVPSQLASGQSPRNPEQEKRRKFGKATRVAFVTETENTRMKMSLCKHEVQSFPCVANYLRQYTEVARPPAPRRNIVKYIRLCRVKGLTK